MRRSFLNGLRRVLVALSALGQMLLAAPGNAEDTSDDPTRLASAAEAAPTPPAAPGSVDPLQEIVVTATRRRESLKDVPGAVSALSGDQLTAQKLDSLLDLNGTIPDVQISANNADVTFNVRGIGNPLFSASAENSVAFNQDGVYVSRAFEALSGLFDVERIEVLKGPQGTLYGRNATGGAINVISKAPTDEFTGYAALTGANYGRVDAEGVVSGPIVQNVVDGRVGAYAHERTDGYGRDLLTGAQLDNLSEQGAKGSLAITPLPKLKINLRGDVYHAGDADGLYHYAGSTHEPFPGAPTIAEVLGGQTQGNIRDSYTNVNNHRYVETYGLSADVNYDLSDQLSLKSITGWRHGESQYQLDLDGTSAPVADPFILHTIARQTSEELQLHYTTEHIDAIWGAYYYHENVFGLVSIDSYLEGHLAFLPPGSTGRYEAVGNASTDAKATFLDVQYHITKRLTAGAGIRYSTETKREVGTETSFFTPVIPTSGSRNSSGTTPRFTLLYELTDDLSAYGTASRGFKSGEWNLGFPQYALPEYVWDYEGGIRGRLFDRRVSVSLGAFYYDFTNFQYERVEGPSTLLQNAPGGVMKGIEADCSWALPAGFALTANGSYLRSRIKGLITQNPNLPPMGVDATGAPVYPTQNLTGNQFPYAPKWTVNGSVSKKLNFGRSGDGELLINAQWVSPTYLDIFNRTDNHYRAAYALLNASYAHHFAGDRWSITAWGHNLTNRTVIMNETDFTVPSTPTLSGTRLVNLNDPRTYGLTLKRQF